MKKYLLVILCIGYVIFFYNDKNMKRQLLVILCIGFIIVFFYNKWNRRKDSLKSGGLNIIRYETIFNFIFISCWMLLM
jgi:hypothetical protein